MNTKDKRPKIQLIILYVQEGTEFSIQDKKEIKTGKIGRPLFAFNKVHGPRRKKNDYQKKCDKSIKE